MTLTANQYRVYLVLFLLAISSWFLADLFDKEVVEKIEVVDHSPEYFSIGYYKKEMNEQGLLANELKADKMVHYADDGTTHLDNPVMAIHSEDTPPWVIKAESGVLEADRDHLLLSGNVFISRDGNKKLKPFNINTSDLYVQLSISFAKTKQWAEILDNSNRTQGVGMEATFANPLKVKFLSRVKGRYELN